MDVWVRCCVLWDLKLDEAFGGIVPAHVALLNCLLKLYLVVHRTSPVCCILRLSVQPIYMYILFVGVYP